MVQRSPLQEAAERLLPYHQGRFDNLCDLYSVLNAIQLAQWPMLERNAHRSRRLFQHGIATLEHEGLLHSAIKYGIDEATWTWLTDRMVAEAGRLSGTRLHRVPILRKPSDPTSTMRLP